MDLNNEGILDFGSQEPCGEKKKKDKNKKIVGVKVVE